MGILFCGFDLVLGFFFTKYYILSANSVVFPPCFVTAYVMFLETTEQTANTEILLSQSKTKLESF